MLRARDNNLLSEILLAELEFALRSRNKRSYDSGYTLRQIFEKLAGILDLRLNDSSQTGVAYEDDYEEEEFGEYDGIGMKSMTITYFGIRQVSEAPELIKVRKKASLKVKALKALLKRIEESKELSCLQKSASHKDFFESISKTIAYFQKKLDGLDKTLSAERMIVVAGKKVKLPIFNGDFALLLADKILATVIGATPLIVPKKLSQKQVRTLTDSLFYSTGEPIILAIASPPKDSKAIEVTFGNVQKDYIKKYIPFVAKRISLIDNWKSLAPALNKKITFAIPVLNQENSQKLGDKSFSHAYQVRAFKKGKFVLASITYPYLKIIAIALNKGSSTGAKLVRGLSQWKNKNENGGGKVFPDHLPKKHLKEIATYLNYVLAK